MSLLVTSSRMRQTSLLASRVASGLRQTSSMEVMSAGGTLLTPPSVGTSTKNSSIILALPIHMEASTATMRLQDSLKDQLVRCQATSLGTGHGETTRSARL